MPAFRRLRGAVSSFQPPKLLVKIWVVSDGLGADTGHTARRAPAAPDLGSERASVFSATSLSFGYAGLHEEIHVNDLQSAPNLEHHKSSMISILAINTVAVDDDEGQRSLTCQGDSAAAYSVSSPSR